MADFPAPTIPDLSATNLTPSSICSLLSSLAAYPQLLISYFLKKLLLLQRIAALIEQAGDLISLPDISNLVAIADIGLDEYNAIRASCCALGLPPASDASLNDLRQKLLNAFSEILQLLNQHPYARFQALQDELDALLSRALSSLTGDISGLIACVNALCAAGSVIANVPESITSSFDVTGNSYTNFLSSTQQQKSQQVADLKANINGFIGTYGQ